ncbi:MAG: AzlC family ABC transporter permease [Lachnospiraceae bacterium]|nr:AzlC family ABC transporter permease [Lachnospiraceae bacterium]
MEKANNNRTWYIKGIKDGIPIALGYFAVSFALGITAREAGITPLQAGCMSAVMLASAGQFAAINVIAAADTLIQMAVTTLVINLRYILMSSSMSQKLDKKMPFIHRLLLPCFVTDEIFGIASNVEGRLNPFYNYGAATVAVPGWTLGTILGAAVGAILPERIETALSVALYGMFLAIIIPGARKNKVLAVLVSVSMLLSFLFSELPVLSAISSGTRIILLTVVIAAAAAFLRPIEEETEEEAVHGD